MTEKFPPSASASSTSSIGCSSAFAEVLEDFVHLARERLNKNIDQTAPTDLNPTAAQQIALEELAELRHLLTDRCWRVLEIVCNKHMEGEATVSRAHIAARLEISETHLFKVMRDIRLTVRHKGIRLVTHRGEGTYALERLKDA